MLGSVKRDPSIVSGLRCGRAGRRTRFSLSNHQHHHRRRLCRHHRYGKGTREGTASECYILPPLICYKIDSSRTRHDLPLWLSRSAKVARLGFTHLTRSSHWKAIDFFDPCLLTSVQSIPSHHNPNDYCDMAKPYVAIFSQAIADKQIHLSQLLELRIRTNAITRKSK